MLITNDPWQTAGQINDITITTPIFRNGKLVALFANTCHSADIGGRILSAEAREVFEEGLRIPIMKLFDRGEPNQILMQIVRANVRQPDEVIGDFYAQTACNETGGRALLEMMDEFDLDWIDAVAEEIIRRSETAVRAEIRKLPNGEWTNETWSDGFEEPIVVRCTVRIAGDEIFIDFTGSSPQSTRGINVVLELHACLCELRDQSGDLSRRAAQRRELPSGARQRAAGQYFQCAGSGAGREPRK